LAEERFWALARRVVEDHRRRFPDLAGRADRFDVLAPEVAVEQLTTRRLLPDTEVRLQHVRNPLAGVDAD
jgi:siderophore synthetase component